MPERPQKTTKVDDEVFPRLRKNIFTTHKQVSKVRVSVSECIIKREMNGNTEALQLGGLTRRPN